MAGLVDLKRLGGIIPKTITRLPRPGNAPWRTIETAAGMLNSIGLDNDGHDAFIAHHLPYLASVGAPIIVSIAGRDCDEFVEMAARLDGLPGVAAIELNISCPNVSHGVDLGVDPEMCRRVVAGCRAACRLPIIAKLTPNVTNIAAIAQAAADGGADAISVINTCLGMAIDWRRRRPMLGNIVGRAERAGDQADRPAVRVPDCPRGQNPGDRHRRHRHDRRCDGVSRRRGNCRANRHGELLQSHRVDEIARRAAGGDGRVEGRAIERGCRHAADGYGGLNRKRPVN